MNAQTYNITDGGQVSTCSGTIFDSGGGAGNYGNNESSTMTFCSSSANCLSITFTALDLGATNGDKIRIYDGPTTAYAVLQNINGTNEPAVPFTASSTSGCLTIRFTSDGANVAAGFAATISCAACPVTPSYNNPNGFIYTCSALFYDNQGPGTNYGNNQNRVTKICSSSNDCVIATFTAFDTEAGFDILTIYDGNSTADPVIGAYSGVTLPGTAGVVTSSTGCLTFEFISDASTRRPGWEATISCGPCGVPPPPSPQNCTGAIQVCSDQAFAGNSNGSGSVNDLNSSNDGCLFGENQSSWYFFQIEDGGNLELRITPDNGTDDYDFALWGPLVSLTCPPVGAPIRCSYAAGGGTTGMVNGSGDNTEGAGGNRFVNGLTGTLAGQIYLLVVDNFSESTQPFTLDWSLSGGCTLGCTPLPVELNEFSVVHVDSRFNKIKWSTLSELNNDYFILERSIDVNNWESISKIKGFGNSNTIQNYDFEDHTYFKKDMNYYRLKQVDFNGAFKYSQTITVKNSNFELIKTINLYGQEVNDNYKGFVLEIYSDGSTLKSFR